MRPGTGTLSPIRSALSEAPFSSGPYLARLPSVREISQGTGLAQEEASRQGVGLSVPVDSGFGLGAAFSFHSCYSLDFNSWEAAVTFAGRKVCKYSRQMGIMSQLWIPCLDPQCRTRDRAHTHEF